VVVPDGKAALDGKLDITLFSSTVVVNPAPPSDEDVPGLGEGARDAGEGSPPVDGLGDIGVLGEFCAGCGGCGESADGDKAG
jgi:hypothetical protein